MKFQLSTSLLLASLLTFTACKPKSAAPGPGGSAAPADTNSPVKEFGDYPRTVRTWLENGTDPVETSGNAVTADLTERFFGELDWSSPNKKPTISLEMGEADWLRVQLTENATEAKPQFVAVWRKKTGSETIEGNSLVYYSTYSSPVLDDAEEVLDLLKSYAAQDKAYETALEWTDLKASGEASEE